MIESSQKLQLIAIHLENAKSQLGMQKQSSFHQHYENLEDHIYWLVCRLDIMLVKLQHIPEKVEDLHLGSSLSAFNRNIRDYLIIRDYCRFLQTLSESISIIAQIERVNVD